MQATDRATGPVRGAALLCLFAFLGGCGATPPAGGQQADTAAPVQPPSATAGMQPRPTPPTAPPETVFVFNTYGNEQGEPDQRPGDLVASPTTTFTGLEWDTWGGGPARGTGSVQGTWCLPDCQETPYAATVELSGAELVDGTAFYTAYSFTLSDGVPPDMRGRMREVDSGRLELPSGW